MSVLAGPKLCINTQQSIVKETGPISTGLGSLQVFEHVMWRRRSGCLQSAGSHVGHHLSVVSRHIFFETGVFWTRDGLGITIEQN